MLSVEFAQVRKTSSYFFQNLPRRRHEAEDVSLVALAMTLERSFSEFSGGGKKLYESYFLLSAELAVFFLAASLNESKVIFGKIYRVKWEMRMRCGHNNVAL